MVDDLEAEHLALQVDRIAAARSDMLQAIDHIIEGAYAEPSHNKKRAKKQLVKAWATIANEVQAQSEPAPRFRPNVGNPMPRPRHRDAEIEEVRDFVPSSLPTAAMEVAL